METQTPDLKRPHTDVEPDSPLSPATVGQLKGILGDTLELKLNSALDSKLAPVFAKLQNVEDMVSRECASVNQKYQAVSAKLESTTQKYNELLKSHTALHERVIYLECQSRRNNLRISGIPGDCVAESWAECTDKVKSLIEENLQLDISTLFESGLERCHRIGRYSPNKPPRPVVVKFGSFVDRELVWAKRTSLKGTNFYLSEDYPPEVESRRKVLWPYYRQCKSDQRDGKDVKVRMSLDRLIIDGRTYTADTVDKIPDKFHPVKISTKEVGESTIAFWGKDSYLSNHHPAVFSVQGQEFSSMEQYLMHAKAMLFRDDTSADKILQTKDCVQQKQYGKQVKGFDRQKWELSATAIAKTGLLAKFSADQSLKERLLATKGKTLVEASPHDTFWGIGMNLHNPAIADQARWKGLNKLGTVLEEVRDELE